MVDDSIPPPDPLTSFSPDSIFRFQVLRYVVVACLTLCVWDWLLAISDEYQMIRQGNHCLRYVLYMLYLVARICPIIYLSATILLSGATTETCRLLARFVGAANIVIMPAASGLFFIRLSAVYSRNKYIMTFFGFCWLATLGFFLFDSARVLLRSSNVGQSVPCLAAEHKDAWGYIATAVYDTFMYIAISWRLASCASVDRWQDRLRLFVTGDGLGWLSQVLLRSGQMYYFVTIGVSMCTAIFIYSSSIPSEWNSLFITPNITVASIMACRIFRELKLGLFADPITDEAISNIVFKDMGAIPQPQSGHVFELHTLGDAGRDNSKGRQKSIWRGENRSDGSRIWDT